MKPSVSLLLLFILFSFSLAETSKDSTIIEPHVDSTKIDSLALIVLQDSLKEQLTNQKAYLYEHPDNIDTLYNTKYISRYRIHRMDNVTWADLLQHPLYSSSYYTPNSPLNKVTPVGRLFPQKKTSLLHGIQAATLPSLPFEPLHVKGLNVAVDGTITPEYQRRKIISPEIFLYTETGLFGGNGLELRLLRNLTRNISMGVFTSYRELERKNYTHNNGSMYRMFKGWGLPEEDLSNTGKNPLATSHISRIALKWHNRSLFTFDFTYGDLRNDHVYTLANNNATLPDTAWFQENDYLTELKASFEDTLGSNSKLFVEGIVANNIHTREPISTQLFSTKQRNGGRTEYEGLASQLSIKLPKQHELSFSGAFNRNETERYNHVASKVYVGDLTISDTWSSQNANRNITLAAGPSLVYTNELNTRVLPRYKLSGNIELGKHVNCRGFFKSDIIPVLIAYDTASFIIPMQETNSTQPANFNLPSFYGDYFLSSGADITFTKKKLQLYGAYHFVSGVDSTTISSYWSEGLLPYANPTHSVTFAPSLFFNNKVHLTSAFTFSDTKPFIRNKSSVVFHINRYNASRHFYINLYNTFWSERDPITYTGSSDWHKPINDIGIKLTAEIKTFRIFYKMDNLINRNNSYIPGYHMPGFIIRWGFNWTITG